VKKIKIVQVIGIALFCIYLMLFVLDLIWGILYDYDIIVFSMFLALISLSMIAKGVLLKSGSTLWFAINLILSAIFIIVINICRLDIDNYYYIISIIPLIASVFNLIIFRYNIYIKLLILNTSIIIPVMIWQFLSLNSWMNLIIACISIVLGILISRGINFGKEKV